MHVGQTHVRAGIARQRTIHDGVGSTCLADWVHPLAEDPLHAAGLDGGRTRSHPDQYAPLPVSRAPTVLSRMYRSSAGDQFSM